MPYGATLTQLEAGNVYKAIVPQKIPLGGSVNGSRKPGLFKVYMPSADGGALEIKTSAGKVEVYAPDGSPARDAAGNPVAAGSTVKFEVPDGLFGWFGVVVRDSTSYKVEAKLTISGNARERDGSMLVPWNFYYYPYVDIHAQGTNHPSAKWQRKFGGQANDWERTSFWASEIKGGGSGRDGHAITKEFVAEYNKFTGDSMKLEDCGWWGHCDAASTASAIFAQPAANGEFSEADMEYICTEIAQRGYELRGKFHLGGLNGAGRKAPSNKEVPEDKLGQAVDLDVGPFHDAIIETIKKLGSVALLDMRAPAPENGGDASAEVWNQATYKFTMEAKQAQADGPGIDPEASARVLEFKTVLTANADRPPAESTGNPETGAKWVRECYYVLNYDGRGKVVHDHPQNNYKAVRWNQTKYYAPRYVFEIKGLQNGGNGNGNGNPHISLENAKRLGVKLRPKFGG